jgi:aspartyl/asparaginyl beta-hydroxylase (cupin superfamily)
MPSPLDLLNRYFAPHVELAGRSAFLDSAQVEPALHSVTQAFPAIRSELETLLDQSGASLPAYHEIDPRQQRISGSTARRWSVYPFESFGNVSREAQVRCPQTAAAIRMVPSRLQAFFSILEPGKSIPEHCGPFLGYLRYHLALIVPPNDPPSIVVNGQRHVWMEGEGILFDDNYPHRVDNESDGLRAVLIIDIRRPLPPVPDLVNRIATGIGGRLTVGRRMMRAAGGLV